ncbi:glycosyltransferase family 2 protein [Salipiger sp. IMCC34102]|uniref:glycosyltransferase family 2 protein n=1 Tax=Salipiger sp. IMCC34102 TaxID=2510647 RepID=UPI00101D7BDC|nr:glycosyltransferase family 2 protein [Salipiger sp. IMCC34102]RYH00976.1 glycosyltransferase family 2 protein [Salipiger sp. IMCC34102]
MTDRYALIAATRNEGPFLLEWIAYHRVIGFTDLIVFADESADGSQALLRALSQGGAIQLEQNDGSGGPRARAYERAMRMPQVQSATYAMALDVDEFVNIHAGDGLLADLVEATKSPDAISLCWRLFGQSDMVDFEDAPILDRLTWAAPLTAPVSDRQFGIKTLFKPTFATGTGPHRPTPVATRTERNTRWVNGSGRSVSGTLLDGGWKLPAAQAGYALAQVNHYPIRSGAIFALHNLHGPALGPDPIPHTMSDYFALNLNHQRDTTIQRHAEALAAEIARLRDLPGVAEAHDDSVTLTRRLLRDVLPAATPGGQGPIAQVMDAATAQEVMKTQQADADTQTGTASPTAPTPPAEGQITVDRTELAPAWLADLRRTEFRRGWYASEEKFAAQFTLRSRDTLIVSFDNLSTTRDPSLARETWGYPFYAKQAYSHMGVMAFDRNWYRDEALFDFMESKRGLFDRFETVVMTGTSMGAYAATAFADLAPGCTVLAYSPQATLDTRRVPWEERFGSGRKQDWSGRYAFAPDHCRKARAVYLIYDPYFEPDRRHAEFYQGDNILHLKSWYASHKSALFLRRAEVLKDITLEAIAGTLTAERYYELYRARRNLPWYLNGLADHVIARDHPRLAEGLARHLAKAQWPSVAQGIRKRLDKDQAQAW